VAGHRSPSGRRARPAVVPDRGGAAHRAVAGGQLKVHVLAAAAAVGAVATGTLTALLPGSPASADPAAPASASGASAEESYSPVLSASAGVLRPAGPMKGLTPFETMTPVAYALDQQDDASTTEQRVALVEKAGRLAAQLADLHAQEQRDQAGRARTAALIQAGGLDGWIAQALQIMGLPQNLAPGVKRIILNESGGNPNAVNRWDTNAQRGTPSRGLMQTIPSTFRTYVHPDLAGRPINDPVANITAGVRYMIDRYGMDTVQAGGRSTGNGNYLGY
jgi:soluble lytic murein transglycosylase-like protein